MKNAITYVLATTIILAFSGLADGSGLNTGGQQKKKKGPPNTTRTNGNNNGGQNNNGKTNRKNARKPTNGGQNNNGKTNSGGNGGNNNNGQTSNKPTQKKKGNNNNNKPTQKKKPSLVELLGLKGEVAKKFVELHKKLHATVKRIAESKLSPENKAIKIRVEHRKHREEIAKILSEEQLAKLRMIHLRRAQSNNNKHPHIGPFVAKALNLTKEQIKKLAAVRQHACEKKYKVLTNKNLNEEEKKTALKEIHEQVRARTAEILTKEQLEMLKEIHAKIRQMAGSNGKKKSTGNPES
jgi:Spy/CpxP family protein refolding chaperone